MAEEQAVDTVRDDDLSKDEYDLALAEGIDDETLLENPSTRKFSINSYGADYTVDSLVKRMRGGAFRIPEFQRQFVWTLKHSSKFIESLLMGLPVPGIFLYKEADTNQHLVIDGQQRLKTLQAFYDGIFAEKRFRLTGVREPWLNKSYDELDAADVLKLDDSIVHATIFQQDQPQDVLDSIYFVFERINSGGIRLSPQEIRNCISLGAFIKLVKQLNAYPGWRAIFGPLNKRAKDEELIVRFCAFYNAGDRYSKPMNKFLNDFSDDWNKATTEQLESLSQTFKATIDVFEKSVGNRAFRLARPFNAAVFDSAMVGLAKRIDKRGEIDLENVKDAYDLLLSNDDYRSLCEKSTADEENVRRRLQLATDTFSSI